MRNLAYIFLIIIPLLASCRNPQLIRSEVPSKVSSRSYEQFHQSLFVSDGNSRGFTHSGELRRPAYQHDPAREIIAANFRDMGYITWLDAFSFEKFGAVYTNCANVVAVKRGTTGKRIHIIGAHYDTVDSAHAQVTRCPGADDNGSGVAGLLETARIIQNEQFRDTIIFIAFDAEEKGSYANDGPGSPGALHFINTHTTTEPSKVSTNTFLRSGIIGMVSIDMIGYDDAASPPFVVIGRKSFRGSSVGNDLERSIEMYSDLIPFQAYAYNQSDHMPFHHAGIDAVQLMEYDFKDYWNRNNSLMTENPHYHTDADSIDSPDYISYDYAAEITKCVVGYLCNQAGLIPFQGQEP
ncbi:M20/M25/M40 family metallo-hydrolase [Pontiellaceae bacterium B1224]|nr:M20/M25/M40 family metallo-hydrolase [Pontiellaceae bacterium B1224]